MPGPMLAVWGAAMAAQALGSILSARGQKAEGAYISAVQRNNALAAKHMAKDAKLRGDAEEESYRYRLSKLKGAQRAAVGASGAVVGAGSAADVEEATAAIGELDILRIRNNAAREAYGYRQQSKNYLAQARLTEAQTRGGVISTILGGLGGMAQSTMQAKSAGII